MAHNISGSDNPEGIVPLWHEYRAIILGSIAAVVVVYRSYSSLRKLLHQEAASLASLKPGGGSAQPRRMIDVSFEPQTRTPDAEKIKKLVTEATPKGAQTALKRMAGSKKKISRPAKTTEAVETEEGDFDIQILIFYSSLTGSTANYAHQLKDNLFSVQDGVYPALSIPTPSNSLPSAPVSRTLLPPQTLDLSKIELDGYFITPPESPEGKKVKYIYLIVVPSYETDSPVAPFLEHLQETHHDFRIDTAPLRSLGGFAVFGFGDSSEWPASEGRFCKDAADVDKWMGKLTGGRGACRRMFPLGMGDVNPAPSVEKAVSGNAGESFEKWRLHFEDAVREYAEIGSLGGAELRGAVESGDEDSDIEEAEKSEKDVVDLEDLGGMISQSPGALGAAQKSESKVVRPGPLPIDFTTPAGKKALAAGEGQSPDRKEMVPKDGITYKALTKQGYTIVGSHSGVKICRWTKSALRGRGSCYKFSFYGIRSHLCMETTPSLSCSNKCVFCWRHGTNPVGTTWRWKVDPPEEIFKGVVEGHYRKIKMMKGVPGVRADRFSEAFRIRHCALSLVGEPIFYPYINEFVKLLHDSKISSFLVCNAQHPAQLAALGPVTQLYVSIDASNKESLKRIDRPLHRDFWERFQQCLDILREKRHRQRTVFRLTLVKGFNVEDEVQGYADLVEKGLPCFVEIKGVTYCGTSASGEAGLTMGNVPWYAEVVEFVKALDEELQKRGLEYGIAAEHTHSCCVLIASKRFLINGKWRTLINYGRFFELLEEGREFAPEDYVGEPTPEWATWGNGGFNPEDERWYRNGKGPNTKRKVTEVEEESGGCG